MLTLLPELFSLVLHFGFTANVLILKINISYYPTNGADGFHGRSQVDSERVKKSFDRGKGRGCDKRTYLTYQG